MGRWTPEARAQQARRMRELHRQGRVSGGNKRKRGTVATDEAVTALRRVVRSKDSSAEQVIRASYALARITGEKAKAGDELELTAAEVEAGVVLLLAHPWPSDVLEELREWVRALLASGVKPTPIDPKRAERILEAVHRFRQRREERAAVSDELDATINRLLDRDLDIAFGRAREELATGEVSPDRAETSP